MQDKLATQNQLKNLKEAYASGVLRVRYADSEVMYQSMNQMKKAINRLEKELGLAPKIKLFTQEYDKGL